MQQNVALACQAKAFGVLERDIVLVERPAGQERCPENDTCSSRSAAEASARAGAQHEPRIGVCYPRTALRSLISGYSWKWKGRC